MAHIWKARYSDQLPNMACCRVSVHEKDSSFRDHQCTRPVKITRDGIGYCLQHDPVTVAERREARDAKWQARWADDARRYDRAKAREAFRDEAVAALRLIASGHNDARGVAQAIIDKEPL